MKRFHLLMTISCLFTVPWSLVSCNNEDAPLPIDLETIANIYKGDKLRIFLNGEEYSGSAEEAALSLSEEADGRAAGSDGKMKLTLLPLWPTTHPINDIYYENITMDVETTATSESVMFKGEYSNDEQTYILSAEGAYENGILTVNLNYTANVPNITGNAFVFDFSDESVDLSSLNPRTLNTEYEGQQIPIKEFVEETAFIMMKALRYDINAKLRIAFNPDGSADMGMKQEGESTFTSVAGKHEYRFHDIEYGYLQSDTEGVTSICSLFQLERDIERRGLYSFGARDKRFIPIYYHLEESASELYLTIDHSLIGYTCKAKFIYIWTEMHEGNAPDKVHGLSTEETKKLRHLYTIFNENQIERILICGLKE